MCSPVNSADTRHSLNEPIPSSRCNAPINLNEKITTLTAALIDDLNACDMKWTFFVAAAHSYRYDSQLKPFPMHPANGKPYEIDALREIIAKVPPFHELRQKLKATQPIDDEIVNLLHWILVRVRDPYLKSVNRSDVSGSSINSYKICFVVQFDYYYYEEMSSDVYLTDCVYSMVRNECGTRWCCRDSMTFLDVCLCLRRSS